MRTTFNGVTPDELVEAGLRNQLFGEPLPDAISGGFGFAAETGVEASSLEQAFALPNEVVEPITRLLVTEGLLGSGNASRLINASVGPRVAGGRRVSVEWLTPRPHSNVEPTRRRVDGEWRSQG